MTGLRVGVYGYFGMGNIGNEGTLEAFLAMVRRQAPEAQVTCFAADVEEVRREHGVDAVQLMSYRRPAHRAGRWGTLRAGVGRIVDLPRTFRLAGTVDVVVVAGTGVLETSLLVQPWSLPYWLFAMALACRVRGRPMVLLAVGADVPSDGITRFFHRWTVRLASSVSYRDEESRQAISEIGAPRADATVCPDLVFGLDVPPPGALRPEHAVVGLMQYDRAQSTYRDDMVRLTTWLVDDGRDVALVVGDVGDLDLAREIRGRVAAQGGRYADQVVVSEARTMQELMAEMTGAGVVVASRFHNVMAGLLASAPTISIGYAEKNARLFDAIGLGDLCQSMESFDLDLVTRQVRCADGHAATLAARGRAVQDSYRDSLAGQERGLFAEVLPAARR